MRVIVSSAGRGDNALPSFSMLPELRASSASVVTVCRFPSRTTTISVREMITTGTFVSVIGSVGLPAGGSVASAPARSAGGLTSILAVAACAITRWHSVSWPRT